MTTVLRIETAAATDIFEAGRKCLAMARRHGCEVHTEFNGIDLVAKSDDRDIRALIGRYDVEALQRKQEAIVEKHRRITEIIITNCMTEIDVHPDDRKAASDAADEIMELLGAKVIA